MPAHRTFIDTKCCTKCAQNLPIDAFGADKKQLQGKNSWCKKCRSIAAGQWAAANPEKVAKTRRVDKLRKKYGMTLCDYDRMLSEQNGKCKLCGGTQRKDRKYFDIDHCHKTGRVRGLLCNGCNHALFLFDENLISAETAFLYLKTSPQLPSDIAGAVNLPTINSQKKSDLKRRFGMTVTQFHQFWVFQGGVCAICHRSDGLLYVDHDHNTGNIRGLLCNMCNLALGRFKDNTNAIAGMLEYLNPKFAH